MNFPILDSFASISLEVPFSEDTALQALKEADGDKSLGQMKIC